MYMYMYMYIYIYVYVYEAQKRTTGINLISFFQFEEQNVKFFAAGGPLDAGRAGEPGTWNLETGGNLYVKFTINI